MLSVLVDRNRLATVRQDAKNVRSTVAALSRHRADALPKIGMHLYPRSLTYHVDSYGDGTRITMYGSDIFGRTVRTVVRNYRPYMFVRLPTSSSSSTEMASAFVAQLDRALTIVACQKANGGIGSAVRTAIKDHNRRPIVHYEVVDAISMKSCGPDRGFNGDCPEKFVQIFVYAPQLVRVIRDLLEFVYDQRATVIKDDVEYAKLLIEGIIGARERTNKQTPETDVKGRIRQEGLRLKPNEQKLHDAAAKSTSLLSFVTARRVSGLPAAATNSDVNDKDDDDVNPWDDGEIDIVYDDDDGGTDDDDGVDTGIDTNSKLVYQALRLSMAFVDETTNIQRTLRFTDESPIEVYEADVDFVIRYMIDAGFKPEECVVIDSTSSSSSSSSSSLNDVEITCDWRSLMRCPIEEYHNTIAPQVCLSVDCEMETGEDGAFPVPETERILQLCCYCFDPVADPLCLRGTKRAFVLDTVELSSNADAVYSFGDEQLMLETFSDFIKYFQPDMLTGWNIENFDLSYLVDRANVLGCGDRIESLCRRDGSHIRIAERAFSSSAHGTHLYKEVTGEGLWVYDLFQAFKRSTSFKLRSYSLEYVSNMFLGDRKEDVAYSAINTLQTSAAGRAKLMRYCMKDAILPARLIGKLVMLVGNIELSRLNGVPMDMICRRGLQIRLKSSLYREGRYAPVRRLFYTRSAADRLVSVGTTYVGAHVEEPDIGYHDEVVITLDFKSLYPSIIVLLWMCVSTLLPGRSVKERMAKYGFTNDDFWDLADCDALPGDRDDQPAFMKSTSRSNIGMVPVILLRLLAERKRVKNLMQQAEKAGDEFMYSMYDMRQLAIKLNCNAIYGVFGAASSFAYCPEIAAMVTAIGRMIILITKQLLESVFTITNDYPFNAKVIYGDTGIIFFFV